MRNSVILVDQIEHDIREGIDRWGGGGRLHRALFPPDHAHGGGSDSGDDPADPQHILGPMAVAIMGGCWSPPC